MTRVLRWAWNGAAALSLLLCVGVCMLWVILGDMKESWALGKIEYPETTAAGFYLRLAVALIPYWLAVLLTTPLPLCWMAIRILTALDDRRVRRLGACPACSYDLTGNTSGVCPECGAAVEPAKAVTL